MISDSVPLAHELGEAMQAAPQPTWAIHATLLWKHRRKLARVTGISLLAGLAIVPRKQIEYRGTQLSEMDLEAILARRPGLVLVDEFAHTNAPGSRHPKRFQDVIELLDAGLDVYTTLNVQHLESRADAVRQITGATVNETVPDSVFELADEIELLDLTPEALLERLHEGKVYLGDRALAVLLGLAFAALPLGHLLGDPQKACDARVAAAAQVDGQQGLVVVLVELVEVREQRLVAGLDRSDCHARVVGEADLRLAVGRRPLSGRGPLHRKLESVSLTAISRSMTSDRRRRSQAVFSAMRLRRWCAVLTWMSSSSAGLGVEIRGGVSEQHALILR